MDGKGNNVEMKLNGILGNQFKMRKGREGVGIH